MRICDYHRPGGTSDNSPAFQRWVGTRPAPSPEGTAEPETSSFSRPFGTYHSPHRNPALKRWAILACAFGTGPLGAYPICARSVLKFAQNWSVALPLVAGALMLLFPLRVLAVGEQQFATPEAAVSALETAAKNRDTNAIHAIFGPAGRDLVSPDAVQATQEFEVFVSRLSEKTELARRSESNCLLQLGADAWPFPIPLVKSNGQWRFDTVAGRQEVLNRRVGRNELGALAVCRAYVAAQREYAGKDRDGDEVLEYAQRLRSTPGSHDGLYWPLRSGDEQSPLGPLIAAARVEGYRRQTRIMTDEPSPYHGYYFKVLTKQGKHAPGGKCDYIINGHMIGGFALVAWPAEWGNSGVMTFIVNQQGKIYQKNLGPKTAAQAKAMTRYEPDSSWSLVKGQ
jgi:Protein of unknown function (DUF2950)